MTGIFLVCISGFWLVLAFVLVALITSRLRRKWWTHLLRGFLYVAILPIPLIDEIVGKKQFEELCRDNAKIWVDHSKAPGKTVYLSDLPDIEVKGTWVLVVLKPWQFVDINTGEVMVSYNTLQAAGGAFIRALGISEGGVPLTFKSTCVPANRPASVKAFSEFGINYVERPAEKERGLR